MSERQCTSKMFFSQVSVLFFLAGVVLGANSTVKRGIFESGYGGEFNPFEGFGPNGLAGAPVPIIQPAPVVFSKPILVQRTYTPSPAEIASAIQAAKEASANVMAAQHRVQDAKGDVLNQQHVASHKQAQAALALQKAEAAAAVQQQEAKSAATALVQAQQRLAHTKAEVAELQKIASAKEAEAAEIIEKSAAAAAAEIQRTDNVARKISALQHSSTQTIKQAAAGKEGSLSATSAAVAASDHADGSQQAGSWATGPKLIHLQPWG